MRKGQAYTMDLFAALSVFLIILFIVLSFAAWTASMKGFNDRLFGLEAQVIAAQDYITLGEDTSGEPYVLDKSAVDALFAQDPDDTLSQFRFTATNYSMKLFRLNDSKPILQSGYNSTAAEYSVSMQRFVVYDNEIYILRTEVWEPRVFT